MITPTLVAHGAAGAVVPNRTTTVAVPTAFSTTRTALILAAILIVAAAIRIFAFHGYWGADDGEYALLANAMQHGQFWTFVNDHYVARFDGPAHLPYRLGLIAPLALLFRLFGVSETVLVAYPLVISLLGVALAFACGRHFFGNAGGLIAALLYALIPVDVNNATQFLPDIVATFYASLAVWIVLRADRVAEPDMKSLALRGLGAGVLFGISWLSKETVTYLVPLCAVVIVSGLRTNVRRTLPLWIGVAIGSASILAGEMTYYAIARGDFMLRMHENERSFVETRSYLFYEGSRFGWPVGGSRAKALLMRLFVDGPRAFFLNPKFLFLPLFGLLASALAWFRKDSAFKIPAVWMLTLILMFNFASPSLATYTPLVLLHRYLVPILLPAAVLTAGLLVRLYASTRTRALAIATSAALVALAGMVGLFEVRDMRRVKEIYEFREIAARLSANDPVYADPLSRKALEFFWQYPKSTRLADLEGLDEKHIAPGSYVIVDKTRLRWLDVNVSMWLTKDYGYHAPTFASVAPGSWRTVWRNQSSALYRVE